MISDSDTHPQGGDSEAAPFMGSEGRQASPNPSQASTAEPVGENGLKPCWSCGGSDAHIAQIAGEMPHLYPIVKCKTCRNRGLPANTEAEAIAAWNTRASPQTEAAPVAGQNNALADELEALITAATPGDLGSAQRHVGQETIECPYCGDGEIEAADYCNFDEVALGVQFYGIGKEFGAHEDLWRWFTGHREAIISALRTPSPMAGDVVIRSRGDGA